VKKNDNNAAVPALFSPLIWADCVDILTPQLGQISAFSNCNGFPQVGQNLGIIVSLPLFYDNH
jgi:hypothetical protein